MTETDLIKTNEALEIIKMAELLGNEPVIGIHSPRPAQERQIVDNFPGCSLRIYSWKDWDILKKQVAIHDLLVFQNVFHYIADPASAFNNVLASCRYLLMQDRIIRNRGKNGTKFCEEDKADGDDCMRFSIGPVRSNFKGAFDMLRLTSRIIFCYPYPEEGRHIHIVALLRGFL